MFQIEQCVCYTYDLVEALGGTQARWAHTDDEDIDVAVNFAVVSDQFQRLSCGWG